MRRSPFLAAILLCAIPPAAAAQASRGVLATGTFAVTGVTVVPMTRDTVVADATVLVRDGRIVSIEPTRAARLPRGARRIDGRGMYLLPGLADMHVHLYSDEDTPDSVAPAELGVMVANGVTAIRLMIGTPEHLTLRREIEAGRVLGPQLWVASPQLTGTAASNARVVGDPETARDAVKALADTGYDFIKLTTDITPPVYEAIVAEAARDGIRVIGHVDPRVGVARAFAAGQHIEHLDNYLESVLADTAPSRESVSDIGVFYPKRWATLDYVDDRKIDRIAGETPRSRTWTTSMLAMFKEAFGLGHDAGFGARPLPWRAEELLGQGAERGPADALDRGAEPAGEGDRRLGWPDPRGLGHAGMVPRLRVHAAPRAREPRRRGPDALAGARGRDPQSCRVPARAGRVGNGRAGKAGRPGAGGGQSAGGHPEHGADRGSGRRREVAAQDRAGGARRGGHAAAQGDSPGSRARR
jgi:hypothetical protein